MFITCPKCSAKYKIPSEINFNSGKKLQCSACQHIFKFFPDSVEQETTNKENLVPPEDAVLTITERTERIVIQEDGPDKKDASLPEAFCPVKETPSQNKPPYFLIFGCLIVLIIFSLLGWMFRDLFWLDATPSIHQMNYVRPPRKKVVHKNITQPKVIKKETPTVDTSMDIPLTFESESKTEPVVSQNIVSESVNALPVAPDPVVPDVHENKTPLSVRAVRFRKTQTGDAFLLEGVLKNITQNAVNLPEKVHAIAYGTEGTVLFEKDIYLSKGVIQPGMEQAFFGTYSPIIEGVQWVDVVLKD